MPRKMEGLATGAGFCLFLTHPVQVILLLVSSPPHFPLHHQIQEGQRHHRLHSPWFHFHGVFLIRRAILGRLAFSFSQDLV